MQLLQLHRLFLRPMSTHKTTKLSDGTAVFCLRPAEAKVLDYHIQGYLHPSIRLNDGDVIFDIGANIGVLGVRMMQRFPNSQLYAFEPILPIFEVLKANAQRYAPDRFRVFHCGISDSNEQVVFSYFPNSPALSTAHTDDWEHNPDTLSKAVEGNINHAPPEYRWAKYLPRFLFSMMARWMRWGEQKLPCQLRTLSNFIAEHQVAHIHLLKIDCEGAELRVLHGIEAADWQRIHQIVAEVHDIDGRLEQFTGLCQQHGFGQITVEKDHLMGDTPLYNVFAVR